MGTRLRIQSFVLLLALGGACVFVGDAGAQSVEWAKDYPKQKGLGNAFSWQIAVKGHIDLDGWAIKTATIKAWKNGKAVTPGPITTKVVDGKVEFNGHVEKLDGQTFNVVVEVELQKTGKSRVIITEPKTVTHQ